MTLNHFTKKNLGINYSWFIPTINGIRVIQKCDLPTACLQRLRTAILTEPVRALIAHAPRLEIDERTARCMRGTWTFKTTYRGVCCFFVSLLVCRQGYAATLLLGEGVRRQAAPTQPTCPECDGQPEQAVRASSGQPAHALLCAVDWSRLDAE